MASITGTDPRRIPVRPVHLVELSYAKDAAGRYVVTMPFRLESRANYRGHTRSKKHIRATREQRGQTTLFLRSLAKKPELPCHIVLVRIAPRELDRHENLPMAFKAVVDGIADWFGINDRDKRLSFEYEQESFSEPHTYGCRIVLP